MHALSLASRRSAAQSGLLATVCAVALVLSGILVGLSGYLEISATENTRAAFANGGPTAAALQVETKLADDAVAQSTAATSLLSREFAGVANTVHRSLEDFPLAASLNGEPLTIPDHTASSGTAPSGTDSGSADFGSADEARVTVGSNPELEDNATIVAGTWPNPTSSAATSGTSISGVLHADAANLLGIAVGDELSFGTGDDAVVVTVVGTWLPKDAEDPLWFSNPGVATGQAVPAGDGTPSFGPLMVDEPGLLALGTVPFVHWTMVLDAASITPGQLDQVGVAATNLRQTIIDGQEIGKGGILVSGTLAETVSTVQHALNAVRGVTPVGILLVALMGLITLVQLARLLSLARRPENALLRSRGASAQWLTLSSLVEAVIVAVVGCALGFVVAAGVLATLFDSAFSNAGAIAFAPWEYAALVAVAVIVIYGATALLDATRIAKRDSIDDSGRARTGATIGIAVLALAAAGVAVWQSLLYGSPLVTNAAGRQVVDPLAVIAPTLALVAIALTLLVAFGPLTDAWQRFATRRRGFQPSYSARQVARGLGSYAVAVLVLVLAVGGLTVASAYSGSLASLAERSATLTAGADVRVDLTGNALPSAGPAPITGMPFLAINGVTAAAPALSTPITMGDNDLGRLLALPSSGILGVVSSAGGALDTARLATVLPKTEPAGIELPSGTTKIQLEATLRATTDGETPATGINGSAQTALWFQNSAGSIMTVAFPPVDAGIPVTDTSFEVSLPASDTPWWIVAFDYSVKADTGWLETSYQNLVATTPEREQPVALDTSTWGSTTLASNFGSSSRTGVDGVTIGMGAGGARQGVSRYMNINAELTSGGFRSFDEPDPVPFVVSNELAQHYGVGVDDRLEIRFTGTGLVVPGTIVGVVPLIPGIQSPNAVVTDLTALNTFILRTSQFVPTANQVWLSTSGPVDLGPALPKGAEVVTTRTAGGDQSFSVPAELALWIAAAGCLLLAAISLGAVALTIGRSRRGEVIVLRAVGVSAREQSGARLKELLSVIGIAVLLGVLNGMVVSWLTIANLAKSAVLGVPIGLQATLQFALLTGLALLAIALVVLLVIAVSYAARVRRQALDTDERLETR